MRCWLVLFVAIVLVISGFSQEIGPHGGNVMPSHEYKIEVTACSEYFEVYLYNQSMEAVLNSGIGGRVTYHLREGKEFIQPLSHWGIDGFSVKGCDDFDYFTVLFVIRGRPITARFENKFKCTDR